jgi:hypothetical protein
VSGFTQKHLFLSLGTFRSIFAQNQNFRRKISELPPQQATHQHTISICRVSDTTINRSTHWHSIRPYQQQLPTTTHTRIPLFSQHTKTPLSQIFANILPEHPLRSRSFSWICPKTKKHVFQIFGLKQGCLGEKFSSNRGAWAKTLPETGVLRLVAGERFRTKQWC